jgi:hypothetical protein
MVALQGFNDARLDADLVSILGLQDSPTIAEATAGVQRGWPALHGMQQSKKASATIAASLGVALITSVALLLDQGSSIDVGEKSHPGATFAARIASVKSPSNDPTAHIANTYPKEPFNANFHRARLTPDLRPKPELERPPKRLHAKTISLAPRKVYSIDSTSIASSLRKDPVSNNALPPLVSESSVSISTRMEETTHVYSPSAISSQISPDATALSRRARQDSVAAIRLLRRQF